MSLVVTLKGALQPIRIESDFMQLKNQLDYAYKTQTPFITAKDESDGANIMFALDNVLTVSEEVN